MADSEVDGLRVVMAEIVESAKRAAAAGAAAAMRMQATSLRSTAELFMSQARALEAFADDVETGRADLPRMPVRLSVVPLDDEPVVDEPDVPEGTLFALEADGPTPDGVTIFRARDHDGLSQQMIDWCDLFDERLRGSPFFVEAVNEAAEAGRELSEETAGMVAARIRELNDAAVQGYVRGGAQAEAAGKANGEGDGDGNG